MPADAEEMVDQAFDPKKQDNLARAIEQLSPEEAQFFLDKLERAIRKRKIQLTGYLAAMVVWLIGMVTALYVYGSSPEGTFVGWVFIIPFAAVGIILVAFGRLSERAARADLPPAAIRPKDPRNSETRSGEIVSKPPPDAKQG
jgi:hypothetical protein